MRPKGWQRESYRHYLAAKGISTRKYNAPDFKKGAEMMRSAFSNRVDHTDNERVIRDEAISEARAEYKKRLRQLEEEGKIKPKDVDYFMQEEFDIEKERYLQKQYDRQQFKDALDRRYKFHVKKCGTTFNAFDWSGDVHGI
jgi:hypothetical protein